MGDLTRRGVLAAIGAGVWAWPAASHRRLPALAGFRVATPPPDAASPVFRSAFIDHDPPLDYVHCPSVCERPDGGIACSWYAGPREGHPDVAIWLSESAPIGAGADDQPTWSAPRAIVDRRTAIADLDRFVRKVGNGVIFSDTTGRMWLVFVTIAVGGWSGSSLNATCSSDGGRTWSRIRRLTLSPFFNISELVRAAPVEMESGEIGLPVYHECVGKFPEMLWLRPDGDRLMAVKSRMAGGRDFLQPTVVPLSPRDAIAYLRDHSAARRLTIQRTSDGGRTWTAPAATPLPNDDSSAAAIRLSSGAVLLAFNSSPKFRDTLSLAVSADGVGGWRIIDELDHESGATFAYPFMIQDGRGLVHLVYSWKKKRVRHVAFNEAWVAARLAERAA